MKKVLILIVSFLSLEAYSKQPLMIFFKDMRCENTSLNGSWYIKSKLEDNTYEMLTPSRKTVVVKLSSISFNSEGSISPYEIFLKHTKNREYQMNNGFTKKVKLYEESFECLEYYLKNVSTQVVMSHTIPKITKKLKDEVNKAVDERKKVERKEINAEKIKKEKVAILKKVTLKGYNELKKAKCYYVGDSTPWWINIAGYQSDKDYGSYYKADIMDVFVIFKSGNDFIRDEGKTTKKYSSKDPYPLYIGSTCQKIANNNLKPKFKKRRKAKRKAKSLYE